MSDVILLSDVILSFPNIVKPQSQKNDDGTTRYSHNCAFLMSPQHPAVQLFMQRFATIASERWRENAQPIMNMIAQNKKQRCYGMGEEALNATTGIPYNGYPGHFYINAVCEQRPQLIDAQGVPLDPNSPAYDMQYRQLARAMYGGCRVNAAIKPWAQMANPTRKTANGIRCELVAIQFFKDGTPFGEAPVNVNGMFGAVAGGAAPVAAPAAPLRFGELATPTPVAAPAVQMPAAPFPGMPGMPSFLGQ
jgi:hypothetical protein